MTMLPLESWYMVYGRTYREAVEVIRRRGLWNCIPDLQPWLGIWFSDDSDLILFALRFQGVLDFSDALAISNIRRSLSVSKATSTSVI